MFGRATIRLGIGPHSSCIVLMMLRLLLWCGSTIRRQTIKVRRREDTVELAQVSSSELTRQSSRFGSQARSGDHGKHHSSAIDCQHLAQDPASKICLRPGRTNLRRYAKFHYAIWSQAGSTQVRSWSQTCSELKFGLSSSLLAAN